MRKAFKVYPCGNLSPRGASEVGSRGKKSHVGTGGCARAESTPGGTSNVGHAGKVPVGERARFTRAEGLQGVGDQCVQFVISFLFVLGTNGGMQPVVMAPKNLKQRLLSYMTLVRGL